MSTPGDDDAHLNDYYAQGREAFRLDGGLGALERVRTLDVLSRHLPKPPARVADVGGGPAKYASALQADGYQVSLLDVVPLHVEQAIAAGVEAVLGDARSLPWDDRAFEAALLLGPLYHLPDRADRLRVLAECRRVLRPKGVVVAAIISRFASLTDLMRLGLLADQGVWPSIQRDIADGAHLPGAQLGFTTAYFHRPEEVASEFEEAGFEPPTLVGLEGLGALVPDLDSWLHDLRQRRILLEALRAVESEPSLLGAAGHIAVVTKVH